MENINVIVVFCSFDVTFSFLLANICIFLFCYYVSDLFLNVLKLTFKKKF